MGLVRFAVGWLLLHLVSQHCSTHSCSQWWWSHFRLNPDGEGDDDVAAGGRRDDIQWLRRGCSPTMRCCSCPYPSLWKASRRLLYQQYQWEQVAHDFYHGRYWQRNWNKNRLLEKTKLSLLCIMYQKLRYLLLPKLFIFRATFGGRQQKLLLYIHWDFPARWLTTLFGKSDAGFFAPM